MKQIVTQAIVLARTNFQEADRILTMLTPDEGKLRLVAKGVRRPRSKLAGGIELFSVSDITFMRGKGELGTLISARLQQHYGQIASDINRTMYGYELLKRVNKVTEEAADQYFFDLLQTVLAGLNNMQLSIELIDAWFMLRLLDITGHVPNLSTDASGNRLVASSRYVFSFDDMAFAPSPQGSAGEPIIKVLRVGLNAASPQAFGRVSGIEPYLQEARRLTQKMISLQLGV